MILIVLLPVGLLTWLGFRMAKDEQAMTQQRFRAVMEQRLEDVNRSIESRFAETEGQLHQITSLDDYDLTALREIIRSEPQVTQLFVLSPEGGLLYPNPADNLNGNELSFLRQAARMFTDRDLQNAVALAEAGAQNDFTMNGPGPLVGMAETPETDRLLAVQSEMRFGESVSPGTSSDQEAKQDDAFPEVALRSAAPAGAARGRTEIVAADSMNELSAKEEKLPFSDAPVLDSVVSDAAAADAVVSDPFNERQSRAALPSLSDASEQLGQPAPAPGSLGDQLQESVDVFSGAVAEMAIPDLPSSSQTASGDFSLPSQAPFVPSSGWFVWYWDRGLNLIYWQRRPSGHIVGAALERSRWIADLISWLPATDATVSARSAYQLDTAFRVVSSSAEPVYQWGCEISKDAAPIAETSLAAPLASWRLQCFVPPGQIAAGSGQGALLGFGVGIGTFALTLMTMAWLLYRDYSRDMREATQQVSFVNQVSHELKTPLTNIRLYADLLSRDLEQLTEDLSEKPFRRLEIIVSEAQRLSRLIGNVLTFARQHRNTLQVQPAQVNVGELVRQIADRFTPSLNNHGIEVILDVQTDVVLWLDPDFVEQILGNLISNVEKYAAAGKQMTIRTSCTPKSAIVDVIDAGPGIPVSQQSGVFVPFSRLSRDLRASTGTGIGLSITRELARLHGGDVTLMESPVGCWFRVMLKSQDAAIGEETAQNATAV